MNAISALSSAYGIPSRSATASAADLTEEAPDSNPTEVYEAGQVNLSADSSGESTEVYEPGQTDLTADPNP